MAADGPAAGGALLKRVRLDAGLTPAAAERARVSARAARAGALPAAAGAAPSPPALPEGTVTFLFTDLEGSTRLLRAHPQAYQEAVRRHHALLREAVEGHGGVVFEAVGDAVYAAFARPTAAAGAALAGLRALQREPWGEVGALRARMGLHSGEVERQGAHYFGAPLVRCARLLATAHGGQTVLSEAAAALVRDALPDGAALRDLGAHRLKDLQRPERVYQLLAVGAPADFPPLRSLEARPHNLPLQLTSFVGRERELAAVAALLAEHRLVTLTGAGGVGKTRLALQAAADALEAHPDGVWLAELAALADPALVGPTIAHTLGVREAADRPLLLEILADHLRGKWVLLVLDNFEHLLGAAHLVTALLGECPRLRILATSRAPLRLAGEHLFPVPPLSLPPPDAWRPPAPGAPIPPDPPGSGRLPVAWLARVEAVRLFVERATEARPDFALDAATAPTVAEVCARLDGLPLALELAAARLRHLPLPAINAYLAVRRLPLLTGGPCDAPARHQTLRATLDWSHDLLSEPERALFRRLAVFAGGCTAEAAAAVAAAGTTAGGPPAAAEALDVLDGLAALVDQNLLRPAAEAPPGGAPETPGELGALREPRFRLPEPVREYALELLEQSGEAEAVRRHHAAYFVGLAERAAPGLEGPDQAAWAARLERDHDNLRAALAWSRSEPGDPEAGLRLGGALRVFWQLRGHLAEGRRWLATVLAAPPARASDHPRAGALYAAGLLAYLQGDHAAAHASLEQSLALCQGLDDPAGGARALSFLAAVALRRGGPGARALAEEAVARGRAAGAPHPLATALFYLGAVTGRSDPTAARAPLAESLERFRAVGDDFWCSVVLSAQAGLLRADGHDAAARALYEEGLAIRRRLAARRGVAAVLHNLAVLDQRAGDRPGARTRLAEALGLFRAVGDRPGAAWCLAGLAAAAEADGQPERAARLLGAADPHLTAEAAPLHPPDAAERAGTRARVRRRLGEAAFAAAWAEGRAMSPEQAVAYALAAPPAAAPAAPAPPGPLSPREREVAALVAQGLTNRQIAARLVVTARTAATHVEHILGKLALTSRVQIGLWAAAHGLAPPPAAP